MITILLIIIAAVLLFGATAVRGALAQIMIVAAVIVVGAILIVSAPGWLWWIVGGLFAALLIVGSIATLRHDAAKEKADDDLREAMRAQGPEAYEAWQLERIKQAEWERRYQAGKKKGYKPGRNP